MQYILLFIVQTIAFSLNYLYGGIILIILLVICVLFNNLSNKKKLIWKYFLTICFSHYFSIIFSDSTFCSVNCGILGQMIPLEGTSFLLLILLIKLKYNMKKFKVI